ncbi:RtcB family protein [Schlesneria sp. T3-172]|uniref:RtcB family protein n=1 Tax=Schlesneria sphaerica TaxID=3373610 RepID=UPI0037C7A2B4
MNTTQLRKLGVSDLCIGAAIEGIQRAVQEDALRGREIKKLISSVLAEPSDFVAHPYFGRLAREIIEHANFTRPAPIEYQVWGREIDAACHAQMRQSCALPMAVGAAIMPDAHLGYGLPIGGVLALENAVVPYAVGVDIACRMKLSILDIPTTELDANFYRFKNALDKGTRFGIGSVHERPQQHAVMDADWTVSRVTRENRDKAWKQLGTSGSGNHFVEFGRLTLEQRDEQLGLEKGEYVALLSHSGSRGTGASVCDTYSNIARALLPRQYVDFGRLAWLDLDSEAGQEYWAAMTLMGKYAAANHDVIHRLVSLIVGGKIIAGVENHHNFAWIENHNGRDVVVHRKGATPAGEGVLGVIPGSMADPAFVVRGKGNPASLNSASHGAGRRMSRTAAREKYSWRAVQRDLENKGVRVLSAGADEVPYAYKNILDVMQDQQDLVETVARFDPLIVKMSDDGRAED